MNYRASVFLFTVYFLIIGIVSTVHSHEEIGNHGTVVPVNQAPDASIPLLSHPEGYALDNEEHRDTHHGEHFHLMMDVDGNLSRIRDGIDFHGMVQAYAREELYVMPITSFTRAVTSELIPCPRNSLGYLHTGLSPPLT